MTDTLDACRHPGEGLVRNTHSDLPKRIVPDFHSSGFLG